MRCTLFLSVAILLAMPAVGNAQTCTTIQAGVLLTSDGDVIQTGYDQWGYNYQAHMFNGTYCDAYRDAAWCQPYRDDELMMKWNDAWLSNQDCDGDGKLDRYYGHSSYIGSGAWLTNHISGTYPLTDVDPTANPNKKCRWNYFVKIVAAPSDAVKVAGKWYDPVGDEIGEVIWGSFAIVQEVSNDPCIGGNGLQVKGVRPGLGNWEDPTAVQ